MNSAAAMLRRISAIFWYAAWSFSRLRRVCGREIFSRGRNTLYGLVSVTGGGIWYARINGFCRRSRFAAQ
jgi:hypothetical protein